MPRAVDYNSQIPVQEFLAKLPKGITYDNLHNVKPWAPIVSADTVHERERPHPDQCDEVLRLMRQAVQELVKKDMCVAHEDYWIFPMHNTPTLSAPSSMRKRGYIKIFVFKPRYNGSDVCSWAVPVKLKPRTKEITIDSLQIPQNGTWIPLTTWLLNWNRKDWLRGEKGEKLQSAWWSRNGQHFPLMRLPTELRASIFQYALGTHVYPHVGGGRSPIYHARSIHQIEVPAICGEAGRQVSPDPNYALLRTNKQVYEEVQKAMWQGTVKHFVGKSSLFAVIHCHSIPTFSPRFFTLTKLHLNFSLSEHYDFLGITIDPELRIQPNDAPSKILLQLPNLLEVELFFRYIREERPLPVQDNPWEDYYVTNCDFPWFASNDDFVDMPAHPCLKTAVDIALFAAFPNLKHVPRVKFSGAVKTSLQKKWTAIYHRAYITRNWAIDFNAFNWDKAYAAMPRPRVYETPKCVCPAACNEWHPGAQDGEFDHDDTFIVDPRRRFWIEKDTPKKAGETPAQYWANLDNWEEYRKDMSRFWDMCAKEGIEYMGIKTPAWYKLSDA